MTKIVYGCPDTGGGSCFPLAHLTPLSPEPHNSGHRHPVVLHFVLRGKKGVSIFFRWLMLTPHKASLNLLLCISPGCCGEDNKCAALSKAHSCWPEHSHATPSFFQPRRREEGPQARRIFTPALIWSPVASAAQAEGCDWSGGVCQGLITTA